MAATGPPLDLSILRSFHYTLYANGTLSNSSHCWLVFGPYHPRIDINGTVTNGTACTSPVLDVSRHATLGMTFASLFVVSAFCSLLNLRKHARVLLPREKRWPALSRCVVWCWLVLVAVCGALSGAMSIDVDRDYIPGIPLVLQGFFYSLMLPPLLAAVWESVRHWACWQERQIYDRNPANLPPSTSREAQERRLPFLFYTLAWLTFFLAIPRDWKPLQFQSDPAQQANIAEPAAMDDRFRAAAFTAVGALAVIGYGLGHGIYHYRLASASATSSAVYASSSFPRRCLALCRATPAKFLLIVPLLAAKVLQNLVSAYQWSISPLNYHVDAGWTFGLGYLPVLLIILLFSAFGFAEPNEDCALMMMRWEHSSAGRTSRARRQLESRPSSWRWKVPYVGYREASESEALSLELAERTGA